MSAEPDVPDLGSFQVMPAGGGLRLGCPACEWREEFQPAQGVRVADLIEAACDHIVEHAIGRQR